jgi:hypothetical protein
VSSQDDKDKPTPSGRVRHDKGGRAIWEWAIDSGRDALDSTSRLLKRLDISSLRLMGDDELNWDKKKKPGSVEPTLPDAAPPSPSGKPVSKVEVAPDVDPAAYKRPSFDPYDNRTPARPATRSKASAQKVPGAKAEPAKRGLLARLFRRGE